jgi:alpha-D-xyloside xylohydrolase
VGGDDQFMFGSDVLVAPVLEPGWTHAWTGAEHEGGAVVTADAPLADIPVYLREGATGPVAAAEGG